jgi:lysophospholipase L1-like esterase
VGGSQPEGFLVDQDTNWPGGLQRLLEQPDALRRLGAAHVHVGCIARSGVGSEALDLIFDRVLPRYPHLSTIIVLVGASDVLRWLEQGASPASPPESLRTADLFRCHPEGPFGWKPSQLATTELLRRARQRWLRPIQVHERAGRWIGEACKMRGRAAQVRRTMPDPRRMLDHFEQHFRRLLQKASAHADRVLVIHPPWVDRDEEEMTSEQVSRMWHGGVGQAWREAVTTYFSLEVVSRLMALLDARIVKVADALQIEHIDLRPLLEPSLADYYDGFHATPRGSRVISRAVAATLLRRPIPKAIVAREHHTEWPATRAGVR